MSAPFFSLSHVSYSYHGSDSPALSDVSVDLFSGEKIALLGNNGAGKSTFFLCCNGVLTPTEGELLLDGVPVGRSRKELQRLRKTVGIVFQDPDHQIIASTVEAEVSFGPLNLGMSREEAASCTGRALEKMNLSSFRDKPPHYLSGGEKKRVSIADILAMDPRLMLLDEPTASLDCAHVARLEETLDALHREGMTLLVSTHDVDFAWRFASRVLVLSGGRLAADGPAEEIFADDALLRRAGLQKPVLFDLAQTLGLTPPPRTREEFQCLIAPSSS